MTKTKVNLNLYSAKIQEVLAKFTKQTEATIAAYNASLFNFQVIRVVPEYIGDLCIMGDRSKQVSKIGSISVEGRKVLIKVHDKKDVNSMIKLIETERGLQACLGNEKTTICVTIPDPSEERRLNVIKELKSHTEMYKAQIQNARRDTLNDIEKQKKAKTMNEDDYKKAKEILEVLKDNALYDLEAASIKQENDIKKGLK